MKVTIAIACILSCYPAEGRAAPMVGELAPPLAVPAVGGGRFDLSALRGKVVVINYWATWCSPCRTEMPALDAFYARFHDRGVELIGISVDRTRDREDVLRAARTVRYPVAIVGDATADGFGKPATLPTTYVIDRAGIVRIVMTPGANPLTEDALERALVPLLARDPER